MTGFAPGPRRPAPGPARRVGPRRMGPRHHVPARRTKGHVVSPPWLDADTQPILMPDRAALPLPAAGRRLGGFDFVRVLATGLVFYTHVSTWYQHRGQPLMITGVLDRFVIAPMQLNADFGFLGFAPFFLLSAFPLAHLPPHDPPCHSPLR